MGSCQTVEPSRGHNLRSNDDHLILVIVWTIDLHNYRKNGSECFGLVMSRCFLYLVTSIVICPYKFVGDCLVRQL